MKGKIVIWKGLTGIILAGLGGYFVYAAYFTVPGYNKEWAESSVKATGRVIEVRETFRNKTYCDHIVIEYSTEDNRILTFSPYDCFSKGTYRMGQTVNIRYGKNDHTAAFIDTGENDSSTSLIMIIMGILLMGCGVLFLAGSVKKERNPE